MGRAKIDKIKLSRMLEAGRSVKDCAAHFGVTPGAISQVKRKLKLGVIKDLVLEDGHRVVDKSLDIIAQLNKVNEFADELLDLLMREIRENDGVLPIMESKAHTKKGRLGDKAKFLKKFKTKDPRLLALKVIAEIERQIRLQLKIFDKLYDMKAMAEFQNEVLTAIGKVEPDVKQRIINELNKKGAIRSIISET